MRSVKFEVLQFSPYSFLILLGILNFLIYNGRAVIFRIRPLLIIGGFYEEDVIFYFGDTCFDGVIL